MKNLAIGIKNSLTSVYGDTTKTFISSLIATKTIDSKSVLGPPRNFVIPVYNNTGSPPQAMNPTENNRLFVCNAPAGTGTCLISLYDIDPVNGTYSYVGSVNLQLPTGNHTIRGLKVYDGASQGATTGWYVFLATTCTVTANSGVYMAKSVAKTDFTLSPGTIPTATIADSKQVYKLENSPFTLTSLNGIGIDRVGSALYARNGTVSTWQIAKFNYTTSTGTPGANGVTTALTSYVTGNLPGVTAGVINNNSDLVHTPNHGPNSGSVCYLFTTNSNGYSGKVSDLGAAVTSWPSLQTMNYNASPRFITTNATSISWSPAIDRLLVLGASGVVLVKQLGNDVYDYLFGVIQRQSWEGANIALQPIIPFGAVNLNTIKSAMGWAFGLSSTTGQRSLVATCLTADRRWDQQYIITKVLDTASFGSYGPISFVRALTKYTVAPKVQYRTSGFGSETGSWVDWPEDLDGSAIAPATQVQFKILFRSHEEFITNPTQVNEMYLSYQSKLENSENWSMDVENSTKSYDSPARSAAILVKAYSSSVPTVKMTARSRASGTVVLEKDTATHASEFQYSNDSGVSWLPLGTIPNTINTTRLRYSWSTPIPEDVDIVWSEA